MIVEFAFALPLLAVLVFGVIDYSMALQDKLRVHNSVRTGVRVGSHMGNDASADEELLLGAGSMLADAGLENVNWVVVYKSTTADGAVPPACVTPSPQSVTASCNAYSGAQIEQLVGGTSPASWFGCGAGSLDGSWCPMTRQNVQALGPEYLGIWIDADYDTATGFFGSELNINDSAVMRLEPRGG